MEMGKQTAVDSHTILYGVFGDPVRHSRSPIMMNRAFNETVINGVYAAFHVLPGQLGEAVRGMKALGFRGVNVTIPHKVEVMKYLDEIDPGAEFIGAVNTIVNENGRLIGYNTDGIGYVRSLKEETGFKLQNSNILVIGAGGAARGVIHALTKERPAHILIANRTKQKADQLARHLQSLASVEGMGINEVDHIKSKIDLVINTTSVGMHPNVSDLPIRSAWFHEDMTVSDLIYNPLHTQLLLQAKQKGCTIHGGLGMFVYQGAFAFEYWTGRPAPVAAMREAVERSLV